MTNLILAVHVSGRGSKEGVMAAVGVIRVGKVIVVKQHPLCKFENLLQTYHASVFLEHFSVKCRFYI